MGLKDLLIQKFPEGIWKDRRLVWDSRQTVGDENPEWVFLPTDYPLSPEIQQDLLKRPQAQPLVKSRKEWGMIWSQIYQNPSARLKVWGVTGTNGKSTTVAILRQLILAFGEDVAELGTLGLSYYKNLKSEEAQQHWETGFTTPEAPTLQNLMAQLRDAGVKNLVMEISSHASTLGRVAGVDFDGLIFTNLSQDHLDFHHSMEAYEAAKADLFLKYLPLEKSHKRKCVAINTQDPAGLRIFKQLPEDFAAKPFAPQKNYQILKSEACGLKIQSEWGDVESPLVGDFNAENIMGALSLLSFHPAFSFDRARDVLKNFNGPRGRMQKVPDPLSRRHVFVDYAHSPDALEKVLLTLQKIKKPGQKLSVVFGCGGDRDRLKRPLMGKIASLVADRIIVTSDNPRGEDPQSIIDEIALGILAREGMEWSEEVSREKAIGLAIQAMKNDDLVLIAGKGHEEFQIIGTQKNRFSDFEVALSFMQS